jgi:hypothetical protein
LTAVYPYSLHIAKRANTYRLTLELQALASGEAAESKALELTFDNHHDKLFGIIERLQQRNPFGDPAQATELAIGLKLFGEVMLKNRSHPLFEELLPAFRLFMETR